ncbi:MAG: Flp pilus assembly protein CpaB [Micrococcales bacterium]
MKVSKLSYIVAIVVAVLAGIAVYVYQSTADTRALAGKQAVNVIVAKADLNVGVKLSDAVAQGLVKYEAFPQGAVPSDALTSIDETLANKMVSRAIGAGQLVLGSELADFAVPNAQIQVPSGNIAVSVSMDDASRVASFVVPGSHVVVYWTKNDASESRVLLADANVLAVGSTSTTNANANSTTTSSLVTLALQPTDASRLILASKTGSLYFGLLAADTTVQPGSGTTDANLLGGN